MRTVTAFEHDYISVNATPANNELSFEEVKVLDRSQLSMGASAFSWAGQNRIKIAQYVGLIASSSIRLEILPKIEKVDHLETRGTLLKMVAASLSIPIYDGDITPLNTQDKDLLDIIILVFARRLIVEIRKGLNRNYRRQTDDLPRLRGKLDITRQFTKFAAMPQILACEFDEFTPDIAMNQLLLCAVNCLMRYTNSNQAMKLLSEAHASLAFVSSVDVTHALRQHVSIDRKNERWLPSLKLARLLLEALYQTAHNGRQDGVALLFDMNKLFEAYVTRIAQKVLRPLGFDVFSQKPQRVLVKGTDGTGAFWTKPDIYIAKNGLTFIVDTKWKTLDFSNKTFGVSQADAYQMHAYSRVYGAKACVLLYPDLSSLSGVQKTWYFQNSASDNIEDDSSRLSVATIDILDENKMGQVLLSLIDDYFKKDDPSVKSEILSVVS